MTGEEWWSNSDEDAAIMEDRECPECKGQCYLRNGEICDLCFGEGTLDIRPGPVGG